MGQERIPLLMVDSEMTTFDFGTTMTESIDHLGKLEEKIVKAAELFRQAQADRRSLQQEIEKLRADFKDRLKRADAQEQELQALRREREDVRNRIEKLLAQIETLTKADSAG